MQVKRSEELYIDSGVVWFWWFLIKRQLLTFGLKKCLRMEIQLFWEILHSDYMITASQGNDEGYVGIEHFKNWLSWHWTSFDEREWVVNDKIIEGDKIVAHHSGYSTYNGGFLDIPSSDRYYLSDWEWKNCWTVVWNERFASGATIGC